MLELAVQGADAATRSRGDSIVLREVNLAETTKIPQSTLVIVTETENLREDAASKDGATSLLPMLSDFDISFSKLKVRDWDGSKFYSDFIKEGLEYNNKDVDKVIMLFESPSSISAGGNAFHNNGTIHKCSFAVHAYFMMHSFSFDVLALLYYLNAFTDCGVFGCVFFANCGFCCLISQVQVPRLAAT